MSMLFAYMASGEGVRVEVLKCFVRRGQNFSYLLCVCMCVGGGGGGFREKITDLLLLINDWSL